MVLFLVMIFQSLVAVNEVTNQIVAIKPKEYSRFLIISYGTGTSKSEQKYDSKRVAKWGLLDWLTHGTSTPIFDCYTQASADMVDLHLATITKAFNSGHNYLRIQVLINSTFISIHSFCTHCLIN